MKIIAIDPGYDRVGVAIIEKPRQGKEILEYSMCIETSSKDSISGRIHTIGTEVAQTIKKWKPEALAIEKLYFSKNQTTAMGVSEARGVIMYEGARANLPIFEYTPNEIKVAVTGYGSATKENVHTMVQKLIVLPEKKRLDDEIDAIAIGLCCLAREKFTQHVAHNT